MDPSVELQKFNVCEREIIGWFGTKVNKFIKAFDNNIIAYELNKYQYYKEDYDSEESYGTKIKDGNNKIKTHRKEDDDLNSTNNRRRLKMKATNPR